MNSYYRLTEKLNELLIEDEDINTVTKGRDIDLNQKDIFGLGHVNVLTATPTTNTVLFSVSIIAADLRNTSKVTTNEKYIGNDNEDDNLNTLMYVLIRLFLRLSKHQVDFRILEDPTLTPFTEAKGANKLDGWEGVFSIEMDLGDVSGC